MTTSRTLSVAAVATVSLLALGTIVISCSNKQTGEASSIVVLGEDSSNLNAIASLAPAFQQASGVNVTFDKSSFEVSGQKAVQDLMRGTGLYDVLMQYNFSLSSFVNNDWVVTFDDLGHIVPGFAERRAFERDLFTNAWREVGFYRKPGADHDAIVGYPFAANTMLLAYSRPMFEDRANMAAFQRRYGRKLTVPRTWREFRDAAEFFSDDKTGVKGVVLQGASGGWLYYEWATLAFSMGGGVMKKERGWQGDASTPVLVDTPASIAATQFYVGLKPFNAGDFFTTGGVEQRELMRTGKVAMALMWSDYVWPLVEARGGERFGFATVPGELSGLAGGSFFINGQSRHKKEAADFVLYALGKENQIQLAKRGLCSPLRSVYQDPGVLAAVPYAKALGDSLERGVYVFEAGPDAEAVQQVLTKWLQLIWKGDADVAQGMRAAQTEVVAARTEIFRKAQRPRTN